LLVDIEGLSASTLAESLLLGVKHCSKATLTTISITIFILEFEMSHTRSTARYRSSNKIIVYFIVANDSRLRKIKLSILLVLLLAKTYSELTHSDDFMHILSNCDCDVKNDLK
jgi:hypothetical protein